MFFDEKLSQEFHVPGIEHWIAPLLKRHKLVSILDVGVGIGFWGFFIKSYIARDRPNSVVIQIIGIDLDVKKLISLRKMKIYDDLICCDARCLPFKDRVFDMIIAIESLFRVNLKEVLRNIEALAKEEELPVFTLGLNKENSNYLLKQGYDIYRVYLRGLMLTKLRNRKSHFADKRVKFLAPLIRLLYSLLRGKYAIALKTLANSAIQ